MVETSEPVTSADAVGVSANVTSPAVPHTLSQRIARFGVASGIGWLLDFCIFAVLVHQGLAPGLANAVGASAAVVWVFFFSVRRIFRYGGASVHSRFLIYALYQALMIAAASVGVDSIVRVAGANALLAKALVTPLTFMANFFFMGWLTKYKNPSP